MDRNNVLQFKVNDRVEAMGRPGVMGTITQIEPWRSPPIDVRFDGEQKTWSFFPFAIRKVA